MPERHDVVIVGSGPLGMVAARRLAQRGARVLVLEEGPAISDPPGSHLRNAERFLDQPDNYLPAATNYLDYVDSTVSRNKLPGAAVTRAMGGVMRTGDRSVSPSPTTISTSSPIALIGRSVSRRSKPCSGPMPGRPDVSRRRCQWRMVTRMTACFNIPVRSMC